jgi:hypothetical protein
MFEGWNIPGRYLVYGDKADLDMLKEKELSDVFFDPEDEADDGGDGSWTYNYISAFHLIILISSLAK